MSFAGKIAKFLLIFAIILTILPTCLVGCGRNQTVLTEQTFLLDTLVSVTYYRPKDRDAVLEALALCRQYELVFSRTDPDSELYRLNHAEQAELSAPLAQVLDAALAWCERSGGRFDITLGGISALYDFSGTAPHRPTDAELDEALRHVGWDGVLLSGDTARRTDPDTVIDLGAAAKGFIADEMKALLQSRGVEHAIISLGGNVLVLGNRPDGKPYQIGIRNPVLAPEPDSSSGLAAAVSVTDASVVTSGVYERCFTEDGITYHHLLNPETGLPLHNGLASVSIVGPSSLQCDILSTVCFAMGPEDGMALIETLPEYEALFITHDLVQYPSSGFPDSPLSE